MNIRTGILLGVLFVVSIVVIVPWLNRVTPQTLPDLTATKAINEVSSSTQPLRQPQPSDAVTKQDSVRVERVINDGKKFSEMDALERIAILREIEQRELPAIFHAMIDAGRVEQDLMKQMGIRTRLSGALATRTPSPEFLDELWAFVNNDSNSLFERNLLIGALSAAGSKEMVDFLIRVATTSKNAEIKRSASASLTESGYRVREPGKVSPSLEQIWRESTDERLLTNTAIAMIGLSESEGVDQLLSSAFSTDEASRARRAIARQALQAEVLGAKAVPLLSARLMGESSSSEAGRMLASLLVRNGNHVAAQAVVTWLQGTNENAEELIRQRLFNETRTEAMQKAWERALEPSIVFRNENNKEAIRAGVDARKAGTVLEPN